MLLLDTDDTDVNPEVEESGSLTLTGDSIEMRERSMSERYFSKMKFGSLRGSSKGRALAQPEDATDGANMSLDAHGQAAANYAFPQVERSTKPAVNATLTWNARLQDI